MLTIIPKPKMVNEKNGFYNKSGALEIDVAFDGTLPHEGYKLSVSDNGIQIVAVDQAGEFYARQTLRQLEVDGKIPLCEIEDAPRYEYRGFMYDVARNFVGITFIKHYLDILAFFKMNVFHWHLADDQGFRLDLESYPELKTANLIKNKTNIPQKYRDESYERGYYTKEDVKDVVEYAKSLHITVVPEIDMPGHLSSVLSLMENLSCSGKKRVVESGPGIYNGIGCIANKDFIDFSLNIVRELANLFPGKYIHLGGDEVPTDEWKTCPRCQAMMKEKGFKKEQELQVYYENILAKECKKLGKVAICWNDYVTDNFDKDIVSHFWTRHSKEFCDNGEGPFQYEEMKKQLSQGRKHIMSSHFYAYLDMPYEYNYLKSTYLYNPSTMPSLEDVPVEARKNIIGAQCNMWTEFAFDKARLEYQIFPRLIAFSEVCWTEEKDYEGFIERLEKMSNKLDELDIECADLSLYKEEYSDQERRQALDDFYCGDFSRMGLILYEQYLKKRL